MVTPFFLLVNIHILAAKIPTFFMVESLVLGTCAGAEGPRGRQCGGSIAVAVPR